MSTTSPIVTDRPCTDGGALPPSPGLLRLLTCGSVDDGKSTLIGRLLYDTQSVLADQLEAVETVSRRRGDGRVDLSLLTDGLRWEREQGITIDVAYRYFSTAARRFILIDSPGHVQYTRNMVTGASHADVAVILVDARKGAQEQTHRHACIAALLGIRHFIVAVNKMDLVGWDREAFENVQRGFERFRADLGSPSIAYVPVSALGGDNVVTPSTRTRAWYDGPTLLRLLESAPAQLFDAHGPARFPVQWVIRPRGVGAKHHDVRGYAGQVASGTLRVGDDVLVMSSGRRSTIKSIRIHDQRLEQCTRPQSVAITLADDIDIGRGDMLVHPDTPPVAARDLTATIVWMGTAPLIPGRRYVLRHATQFTPVLIDSIESRLDVATFRHGPPDAALQTNDIGVVHLRTASIVFVDTYAACCGTGSFVLIDEATGDTVGAGLISHTAEPRADGDNP